MFSVYIILPQWLSEFVLENADLLDDPKGGMDPELWRKKLLIVTERWVFSLILAATLIALLMSLIKGVMKKSAKGEYKKEIWPLKKTFGFTAIGLIPVALVTWVIYKTDLDFVSYIGIPGLSRSFWLLSFGIYLVLMVLFHLLFWRGDFFARKL